MEKGLDDHYEAHLEK